MGEEAHALSACVCGLIVVNHMEPPPKCLL
jgi:hypothetical protein